MQRNSFLCNLMAVVLQLHAKQLSSCFIANRQLKAVLLAKLSLCGSLMPQHESFMSKAQFVRNFHKMQPIDSYWHANRLPLAKDSSFAIDPRYSCQTANKQSLLIDSSSEHILCQQLAINSSLEQTYQNLLVCYTTALICA